MNAPKNIRLNNFPLKLDFSLNCQTENCIYVALCKNCKALESFYIGQTINMARSRFNNHRSCFKSDSSCKLNDSALSLHTYEEHLDTFENKLSNFDMGIIKVVKPSTLDRAEDFYIYSTKADSISLNRYKAVN